MNNQTSSLYKIIAVSQIKPSRYQTRQDFDEAGIKALAESIRLQGLQQAITVRQVGNGYELIAGERRLRATKLLGRETIEAKVIEVVSEADAAAQGLMENLQRQNLNPIEEAEGFRLLNQLDPKAWTQEKIAQIAGRDRTYITQSLGLLKLPAEIKTYVSRLTFSRSHALELMRLPTEELQIEVARKIPGHLTREETRNLIDQLLAESAGTPKPAELPQPPPVDPLAHLWTRVPQWQIHYSAPGTWRFTVSIPGPLPEIPMVESIQALAGAMPDLKRRMEKREKLAQHYAPQNAVAQKEAEETLQQARLPQTPSEHVELAALAQKGPGAVYAWIYGSDSRWAKDFKDKTWADVGFDNPESALQETIAGTKMMQEFGK